MSSDSNLLFGMLALQLDFVTKEQLLKAMQAWVHDKTRPLGRILGDQKALSEDRRELLDALVRKHVEAHDGDPQKSLASLKADEDPDLAAMNDHDINASLVGIRKLRAVDLHELETIAPSSLDIGCRFKIVRQHAKGGLGVVFVARDLELNRQVALKEIQMSRASDPDSRSRFVLEAEITGALEHPGIVPVYGLGRYPDGRPYYAMRFIKGDSLKDALEAFHKSDVAGADSTDRGLAFRRLLQRFIDVCHAVEYAHSKGVLHRDLKPSNVMLGKFGETLVVDWGLAKAMSSEGSSGSNSPSTTQLDEPPLVFSGGAGGATQMGNAIGTPAYMSPEQAAGRLDLLGPVSDVYSLGATLYALLTGQPPFGERDLDVTLAKVKSGSFPPPRQVKLGVDPALEAICLKAMATDATTRYPTAAALRRDLENWIADAPVSAWSEPWTVTTRRWLGRHRVLATTTVAILLLGCVFLGILSAVATAARDRLADLADRERAARIQANVARDEALAAEKRAKDEADLAVVVRKFLTDDLLQLASQGRQVDDSNPRDKVGPDLKILLPQLLIIRAIAFKNAKDEANLVATAKAFARFAETNPMNYYAAARVWAFSADLATPGSDPWNERARESLRLVVRTPTGTGFVKTKADLAARIAKDAAFDSFRDREDYRQLLSDLKASP